MLSASIRACAGAPIFLVILLLIFASASLSAGLIPGLSPGIGAAKLQPFVLCQIKPGPGLDLFVFLNQQDHLVNLFLSPKGFSS